MISLTKKIYLKAISIAIIIIFIINFSVPVYATYKTLYLNDAIRLNKLGLFLGTSNGFDLDKPINRLEGAAMFIRLMGEEDLAQEMTREIPFKDVSQEWAYPYVSLMYHQGYSNGMSEDIYGTGYMTSNQFATYILRALGYSEDVGDFTWDKALAKLLQLKIISAYDYKIMINSYFYRDFAVKLASSALDANYKNSDFTLYEILENKDIFTGLKAISPPPIKDGTELKSYQDMKYIFQSMKSNLQYSASLNTQGIPLVQVKAWLNLVAETASSEIWGWNIVSTYTHDSNYPSKVKVTWVYNDSYEVAYNYIYPNNINSLSSKNQEIKAVADEFLASYITPAMTNEEKIKAVHDYIVRICKYDTKLAQDYNATYQNVSDSYKVYGVLVKNLAVCDGYAKTFKMFMDILGIPSERVVGFSNYNNKSVNHAWNRVYLDGEYKFIDVTWDDPVPDSGNKVYYDYYLLSEDLFKDNHIWNKSQFDINYY